MMLLSSMDLESGDDVTIDHDTNICHNHPAIETNGWVWNTTSNSNNWIRPSQNQIVILMLSLLLWREYWSRIPTWLQNLILYPWRKLVVAPVRQWQRRRVWWFGVAPTTAPTTNTTADGASSGSTTTLPQQPSPRQEDHTGDRHFFHGTSNNNDDDDDDDDRDGKGLYDDDDDDEDNSSGGLLGKLHKIMTLVASATHSTLSELTVSTSTQFETPFALEVTFLVMLQMVRHSRQTTALLWDDFYASAGQPLFAVASPEATPTAAQNTIATPNTTTATDAIVPSSSSRDQIIPPLIEHLQFSAWAYLPETSSIQAKLNELNTKINELKTNSSLPTTGTASTGTSTTTAATAAATTWHLLRHVKANEPGRVSHYIAIDSRRKIVVIAVKGTSALSDMVTDACGVAVRYNLSSSATTNNDSSITTSSSSNDATDEDGSTPTRLISCHEGVLEASLALVDDVQPLVEHLFLPAGYRIRLVGHSLGAGCACMAGLLLHTRIPALRCWTRPTSSRSSTSIDDHTAVLPLEVIAFAPPPILNQESALATAPFITSIVHNDDMIPRSSLFNLVALLRFLSIVNARLDEKGLRPRGIGGAVKLLQRVLVGSGMDIDGDGQTDAIMTAEEIFAGLHKARLESSPDLTNLPITAAEVSSSSSTASAMTTTTDITADTPGPASAVINTGSTTNTTENNTTTTTTAPTPAATIPLEDMDHLFVPGRVIFIYEKHATSEAEPVVFDAHDTASSTTTAADASNVPTPPETNSSSPKKSIIDEMKAFIGDLLPSKLSQPSTTPTMTALPVNVDAIVANGLTPVLRHINVNDRMVSDHMVIAYDRTLRALLREPEVVVAAAAASGNASS